MDTHLDPEIEADQVGRWVQAGYVLCSNGCALDISVKDGRMVGVGGRAVDLVDHGRLGPKGLYGSWPWATSGDRLTRPLIREGGRLVEADWETAMGRVVEVSRRLLDDRGPLPHGIYTSGPLFIEEYDTLAVLGKGGIGTPHMDGNTRLCTATAGAALKESFGSDGQPGSYADIESAEAAVSLAVTAAVLFLIRRPHAPAGATTLIVNLGLLRTPWSLLVAFPSVCPVTLVDWIHNRLSGEPMPVWYRLSPSRTNG